jgi:hypothetical protein
MGGPSLKAPPTSLSFSPPKSISRIWGKAGEAKCGWWAFLIMGIGGWRGDGNARIPVWSLSEMDNHSRNDKEKGGLGDFSPRKYCDQYAPSMERKV